MIYWTALVVINIPIIVVLAWFFFGSREEFINGVVRIFTPDILSALSGELWDDWRESLKILILLLLWALLVWQEHLHFAPTIRQLLATLGL